MIWYNKKDIRETQMPFQDENTLTYDKSPQMNEGDVLILKH